MTEREVLRLARANINAFSQGDQKKFANGLALNSVYDEVATQRKVTGRDAVVKASFAWRGAFPDAKGTITRAFAKGNQAVLEITWQGTHRGTLEGPGGAIPATGKKVNVRATQVITAARGRVKEVRHYFDMMTLVQQLGVAPGGKR